MLTRKLVALLCALLLRAAFAGGFQRSRGDQQFGYVGPHRAGHWRTAAGIGVHQPIWPARSNVRPHGVFHTPGVSIAVVNGYRVEWARGFGVRKPATSSRSPSGPSQAGSISKPIFALAVMRLVEERRLDLDADISRYLTSWKVPTTGGWMPRVTLRQILSHSAGFTVHGFEGYRTTEKLPSVIES